MCILLYLGLPSTTSFFVLALATHRRRKLLKFGGAFLTQTEFKINFMILQAFSNITDKYMYKLHRTKVLKASIID